jgi:hypothetical protein
MVVLFTSDVTYLKFATLVVLTSAPTFAPLWSAFTDARPVLLTIARTL